MLIQQAGDGSLSVRNAALGEVVRQYQAPLRRYLTGGRWRLPSDQADDLLQDFLLAKVLEQDLIARADPARGRFRTFLLTSLDRFTSNWMRDRGGSGRAAGSVISIDAGANGHPSVPDPCDNLFELAWAREVLDRALSSMKADCKDGNRADLWTVFQARVVRPTLENVEPVPHADLAQQLGLEKAEDAANRLVTAKRKFGKHLRAIVGEYEQGDDAIDGEIRDLIAALALTRGGPR